MAKKLLQLSKEEEGLPEAVVVEPVTMDEQIEARMNEGELASDVAEVTDQLETIKENEEVAEELQEKVDVIESAEVVTVEMLRDAQYSYYKACDRLGVTPTQVTLETSDPLVATEGFKEVIKTMVDAIKKVIAKIQESIKKIYVKIIIALNNDEKIGKQLTNDINKKFGGLNNIYLDDKINSDALMSFYKQTELMKHFTATKGELTGLAKYCANNTASMIVKEPFEGYDSLIITSIDKSTDPFNDDRLQFFPKLHDENIGVTTPFVTAIKGSTVCVLLVIKNNNNDTIDIRYSKHTVRITNDLGYFLTVRPEVSFLKFISEVITNNGKNIKTWYKQYDDNNRTIFNILKKLELEGDKNDPETKTKLSQLRKIATIQSHVSLDSIIAAVSANKLAIRVLRFYLDHGKKQ